MSRRGLGVPPEHYRVAADVKSGSRPERSADTPKPRGKNAALSRLLLAFPRRRLAVLRRRLVVALRDRHPSPEPERAARHLQSRRRLPALVLAAIGHLD